MRSCSDNRKVWRCSPEEGQSRALGRGEAECAEAKGSARSRGEMRVKVEAQVCVPVRHHAVGTGCKMFSCLSSAAGWARLHTEVVRMSPSVREEAHMNVER